MRAITLTASLLLIAALLVSCTDEQEPTGLQEVQVQTAAVGPPSNPGPQVVMSLNDLVGDVELAAGSNITITESDNTITVTAGAQATHGILTEDKTVSLGPLFVGDQSLGCPAGYTSVSGGYFLVSPGTPTWEDFHFVGSYKGGTDNWTWKFWNESATTTFTVRLYVYCIPKSG